MLLKSMGWQELDTTERLRTELKNTKTILNSQAIPKYLPTLGLYYLLISTLQLSFVVFYNKAMPV